MVQRRAHISGMCNPWSCQFFGQTKPECHNYCHIPKYWHNHKNTKNVHGWHNTPNKTQSNGLRAGLGSWPHGVHRAMAMLCILHDLWRPWVRAVAAIVPHVGGSIVQKPTLGSPQKMFCASWGTNVCCQKDLCGKVNVKILRFAPPPIWAKMAATARTHGHATSHATCKALPLHDVAMTPAQPTGHWVGLHWGCCANNARFL